MQKKVDWLEVGAPHVWRPYCQMKTAPAPLAVARTDGVRLYLEDGSAVLDQSRGGRADPLPQLPRRLSWRYVGDHDGVRPGGGDAPPVCGCDAIPGDCGPAGG